MALRSSKPKLSAFALTVCALSSACSNETAKPLTQLVLVADTNIKDLETVEFDFSQSGKQTPPSSDRRAPIKPGEPAYMTLVYKSGSINEYIDVSATGLDANGDVVVKRSARVKYARDKSLTVPLHLLSSCVAKSDGVAKWEECESDSLTCTEKGCTEPTLDELQKWEGLPKLDGNNTGGGSTSGNQNGVDGSVSTGSSGMDGSVSMSDGGSNTGGSTGATTGGSTGDGGPPPDASIQLCDQTQIDINSNVDHCGGCDKPCPAPSDSSLHQVPTCRNGVCGFTCDAPRWGNCNGMLSDGCETEVQEDEAACGQSCSKCRTVGAKPESCVAGKCVMP